MTGAAAATLVCLLAAAGAAQAPAAADAPSPWTHDVSGAFRSLFRVSRSYVTGESYVDSMNRVRATVDGGRGYGFSYQLEIDSETHLGTAMTTPDFELVRRRQDAAWADLLWVVGDAAHVYSDVSVYRGTVALRSSSATLTVGRQRIAWGTARFWSPADLFNPIDPLQVEGDIRQGVDAVQAEWADPDGSIRASMVYGPNRAGRSVAAARVGATLGVWDVAGFGGRFRGDWVGGAEVAGQAGGAGLRAEVTYTWRGDATEPNALRATAGWDYAWPKLYLVAEYFYNQGQPSCVARESCDAIASLASGDELITLHRHFVSGGATYDITPLVETDAYLVVDLAGHSVLVNPILKYNVSANVDLSIGAQLFASASGGEFDRVSNLFFTQIDVHF